MDNPSVFFVGEPHEVAHHAAPVSERLQVKLASATEILSLAAPGDLAVFFSEHFDRFRHAVTELKSRQVATLYMIDGILEWRNAWVNQQDEVACPYTMRPALSHKVACIGHSQQRILDSWGNAAKTEVVGIPRFQKLIEQYQNWAPRTVLENQTPIRILVTTAKTPGFTPEQIETTRNSLFDLKNWFSNNPQIHNRPVDITWRLTGGLDQDIDVTNQLGDLTGLELHQQLEKVDAVITTPSTMMLEAMIAQLPVAILDYHNCPHYVNAGWDIGAKEHIDVVIREMLARPESRMHYQQDHLRDALFLENPVDRFSELAESMLETARKQILEQQELNFPQAILPTVTPGLTNLDHAAVFPNAPEFQIDDTTLLQVELSHARREIKHLQRELAQLQSELDQAHQIFEQIESHPIAGPIVRIRQKMLDLMASIKLRKNKLESNARATTSKFAPEES